MGPEKPLHEYDTGAGEIKRVHALPLLKEGPGSILSSHTNGKLSLWNLKNPDEAEVRRLAWHRMHTVFILTLGVRL